MASADRRDPPEQYAASILNRIMRGGEAILPPGTWLASVLIPCLSIGFGGLAWFVVDGIARAEGKYETHSVAFAFAAPFILIVPPITFHLLVMSGRTRNARLFLLYVRYLLVFTAGAVAAAAFGLFTARWWFGVVALSALAASHEILRSWSYAAFTSFFAQKRKMRQDHIALRDRILGR